MFFANILQYIVYRILKKFSGEMLKFYLRKLAYTDSESKFSRLQMKPFLRRRFFCFGTFLLVLTENKK